MVKSFFLLLVGSIVAVLTYAIFLRAVSRIRFGPINFNYCATFVRNKRWILISSVILQGLCIWVLWNVPILDGPYDATAWKLGPIHSALAGIAFLLWIPGMMFTAFCPGPPWLKMIVFCLSSVVFFALVLDGFQGAVRFLMRRPNPEAPVKALRA